MFELVCMCVDAANVFLHGVASIFKPRLLELHNCHEKLIILIVYSSCVQLIWGVEPTHWRTKQQSSSSLNLSIAMGGGLDLEIANSSVPWYLGYFLGASARSLGGNFLGPRWTFLGISKEIPWNFQGFFSKPRWKPRWKFVARNLGTISSVLSGNSLEFPWCLGTSVKHHVTRNHFLRVGASAPRYQKDQDWLQRRWELILLLFLFQLTTLSLMR